MGMDMDSDCPILRNQLGSLCSCAISGRSVAGCPSLQLKSFEQIVPNCGVLRIYQCALTLQKRTSTQKSGGKKELGVGLLSRGATPKVSSPLSCFTAECGMESEWYQNAKDTKKNYWVMKKNPQDCIEKRKKKRTSPRSVSIPRLHLLPDFHLEPINGSSSRDLTGLTP